MNVEPLANGDGGGGCVSPAFQAEIDALADKVAQAFRDLPPIYLKAAPLQCKMDRPATLG